MQDRRRGAVPLRPLGHQRRPAAPDADGAGPRGGGRRRGARARRGRPEEGRPRRAGLRAELRPLRALRRGPSRAVRAGRGRQHRGHAALGRAPHLPQRRQADQPPPGLLGLRRVRGRVAPLGGEGRSRSAARRGRALRLRGADRRGRGREHRQVRAGQRPSRSSAWAAWASPRSWARSPRARAPSSPSISPTTSSSSRRSSVPRTRSTRRIRTSSQKVKEATKGGVDFASRWPARTRAFETAYRITRRGGTTVTAGLPPPTATWAMPATNLVAEERTIKGSYIGTCVPSRDLPRYIDLYMQGKLPVNKLMSGKMQARADQRGLRPAARGQGREAGRHARERGHRR